jgi:hypothetical protein
VHRKMPAWFGPGVARKGPAHAGTSRAAYRCAAAGLAGGEERAVALTPEPAAAKATTRRADAASSKPSPTLGVGK